MTEGKRIEGNFALVWVSDAQFVYKVKGKWAESLWQGHKLAHDVYEKYLVLARDGVCSRLRNLDLMRQKEEMEQEKAQMVVVIKRIRTNPRVYQPFASVPQAVAWLRHFEHDALRYPIMVVLGESHTGKTEWAKSLFQQPLELKIKNLTHFPDKMGEFTRGHHDTWIPDDVRDLNFFSTAPGCLARQIRCPRGICKHPWRSVSFLEVAVLCSNGCDMQLNNEEFRFVRVR